MIEQASHLDVAKQSGNQGFQPADAQAKGVSTKHPAGFDVPGNEFDAEKFFAAPAEQDFSEFAQDQAVTQVAGQFPQFGDPSKPAAVGSTPNEEGKFAEKTNPKQGEFDTRSK